jgi:trypsin
MAPTLALAVALAMPVLSMAAAFEKPASFAVHARQDIVGGTTAALGEFPYMVSLTHSSSHFCGGVLLNAYTVLTAAHCSVDYAASTVKVRAGTLVRYFPHFCYFLLNQRELHSGCSLIL